MKIGRTLPPAAAPLGWRDLGHAAGGILFADRDLQALEREIREHFGVRYVFLLSSGTAALALTLTALKSLSGRRQAVIPAYTCFAVPAAVLHAGLRPAVCDISPATFDFDHALLEGLLTADTLCVVAHHLFGIPSDVARIRALCRPRRIFVVEDAAQAMGVESDGRRLGTLGDVGIFSLGRGKHITCGSGGVIVTNSREIGEAVATCYGKVPRPTTAETVKDFAQVALMAAFIRPGLYWIPSALPFLRLGQTLFPRSIAVRRLSGMKAGLLRHWQTRLAQANRIRSETAAYFNRRLPLRLPSSAALPYVRLPVLAARRRDREEIYARARTGGLGVGLAYPTPVSEIPEVRAAVNGQRFPCARLVADRLLTLPTHHWLSEKDRRALVDLCRGLPSA